MRRSSRISNDPDMRHEQGPVDPLMPLASFLIPASGDTICSQSVMNTLISLFQVRNLATALPLVFAIVLLAILVISFRSRAVVFCQYLRTMTGIQLEPKEVRRVFRERGRNGVRELFLDLIIRADLKEGPLEVPQSGSTAQKPETEEEAVVN